MARLAAFPFSVVLLVGSVSAADPDPRSPPDVFGRPRPHGEPIDKAFIGLHTGRTTLAFGQPMRVDLFAVAESATGPSVGPHLSGTKNAKLELTDAAGKAIPFVLEDGGYAGGNGLEVCPFTVWPTAANAVGVYWKPGIYKMRFTLVVPKLPPGVKRVVSGTFRSNELTFTVRDFGAALDTWDGQGTLRVGGGAVSGGYDDDVSLFLAGLDEPSVGRLRKQVEKVPFGIGVGGVEVARFAPVTMPQDRKLTEVEAKQLIADLKDKDPAVRARAVRSVPPTAPAEVFAAAAKLLVDPFEYAPAGFSPSPTYPLVYFASDALRRLGTPAVEPLISFAEEKGHKVTQFQNPPRQQVAAVLGRISPNDAAEKYLRAAISSGDADRVGAALVTATAWGKGGIEITRAILSLPKLREETRRAALAALGKFGNLKTDGPRLRTLLASTELEARWAAISALVELHDTASLPEFERLSRDVKTDGQTRLVAMHAVLSLADAKTGDRLALDLIGLKEDVNLRYEALCQAGRRNMMAAVPLALDALDDPEEPTRFAADRVLRTLTGNHDGVGYDGRKPDAKRWRDYWAKREKK